MISTLMRRPRSCVLWILMALLCAAGTQARAGEAEDVLVSIKQRLPFISTGEFLFRREPRDYTRGNQVTAAWQTLMELHSEKLVTADLVLLTSHQDADIRALALLGLLAKETPEVVLPCLKFAKNDAPTLPREARPLGMSGEVLDQPYTSPQTVGDVACTILYRLGWVGNEPSAAAWWAPRKDNPDWLAWHEFLYMRATRGTRPVHESDQEHVRRFTKSLEALPRTTRAWVLLYLADDVFMSRGMWEASFATEAEMLAAVGELGPDVLLEFLRSGKRLGLREPQIDKPENGRRFIITYAPHFFTPVHAQALLDLKLYTAAADADPSQVRHVVDIAMKDLEGDEYKSWDRAKVMAALASYGDASDRERAVQWFYAEPDKGRGSSAQSVFLGELQHRRPTEWRDLMQRLVSHPSFEQLRSLDVMYLAVLRDTLEGGPPVPVRDEAAHIRQQLRATFKME